MKPSIFLITGGTGFIGQKLCNQLIKSGHKLILLVRDIRKAEAIFGNQVQPILSFDELSNQTLIDYIINLAGEPIIDWSWTEKHKQKLYDSRILTTKKLVEWVAKADIKPKLLVNASAVGYYGVQPLTDSTELTESNLSPQNDFASKLCYAWEQIAQEVTQHRTGLTILRFGVVLGTGGGALPRLLLPIRLFMGGRIGSGQQIFSWIHIEDLLRVIKWVIANDKTGIYNAVAPNPLPQRELVKIAAKILHRPNWLPIPAWIFRLLLGERSTLLVDGQRVVPFKLQQEGFQFNYPTLKLALENLCSNVSKSAHFQ